MYDPKSWECREWPGEDKRVIVCGVEYTFGDERLHGSEAKLCFDLSEVL